MNPYKCSFEDDCHTYGLNKFESYYFNPDRYLDEYIMGCRKIIEPEQRLWQDVIQLVEGEMVS